MDLSLEFLKARIGQKTSVSIVGNRSELRYRGVQALGTATPRAGILYARMNDAAELSKETAPYLSQAGIIVGKGQNVPKGVPALVFSELKVFEAFCLVNETFLYFATWQERVYRKALERPNLDELMGVLDEVTPNPWYIADDSYRVLAARDLPEVEDISYIWRFLYRNKRLPLETIFAMESMGKIEQMSTKKAAYIPTVEPFNIPFVSKAIETPDGAVAHFYIIGVYTRLSAYEIEIADFLGDLMTHMFARGASKPSGLGRFYDGLLSRLIAHDVPDSANAILEKMFSDLCWDQDDRLRLVVFGDSGARDSMISDRQKLLVIESRCRSRSFFHNGHVTAIIDVEQFEKDARSEASGLVPMLRMLAREFHCSVGVSEIFSGFEDVVGMGKWYDQALFALDYRKDEPIDEKDDPKQTQPVVLFPSVAMRFFQSKVAQAARLEAFMHPAIKTLQRYDEQNHANLLETLRIYLEHDRNVTLTAKLLFVHRNTLLKRMNKIALLTALDLDDAECRKRLLVSLALMSPS